MTKANLKRLEEGKLYYSISEVCTMTGLEQHVLRYWESEFPQLRPKKNRSGNRAYRAKEIKIIRYIKYLLYEEMYTIPGAKKKMADANMADMEGQLTLLRVPATPPPAPQPAPDSPKTASVQAHAVSGNGHVSLDHGSRAEESSGDVMTAQAENPSTPATAAAAERVQAVDGDASHAHDGGEAAARLREELRRVKQELQSLLSALAATGRSAPSTCFPPPTWFPRISAASAMPCSTSARTRWNCAADPPRIWPWTAPGSTRPAWWRKDFPRNLTSTSTSARLSEKPSATAR